MADAAMLSESEAAFYSFASVMLCLYIVPSALYTAYRVLRQPKKLLQSAYFTANAVALALAIAALLKCLHLLQNVDTSGVFDPYEILKISDGASLREIKKAYRRLGRELHPDKNPGNRTAQTLFTRVTKAYEALTDAKGIENYRKFGHPDGPQSRLLDFAFSGFTGGGGNSSALFVLVYFAIVFGVIAFIVYSLHKSSGRRDRTQVSRHTAAVFLERFHEKMGVHDIVELLLSCDEMVTTAGGEADAQEAVQRSKAHDKILKKMESVKALPADILTRIKKHPDAIARENMIALYQFLRRNKLTGVPKPAWLDVRLRKVLLELPYLVDIFATLVAEHSVKRAYPSLTLSRTLALLSSIAQGSFVPDEEALRDQKARLYEGAELPRLSLSDVSMTVLDEANIQPGDWITLQLTISREHVAAGASAPLASTFYDELDPKSEFRKEHLWLLVVDKATSRLYGAAKIKNLAQSVSHKLLFEGPGISGAYELDVRVVCPAYFNVQAATSVAIQVESASKKN